MGKTKKIENTGVKNPFGIGKSNGGFNIGQSMLKNKAGIKTTGDKRKSVRVPKDLYDSLCKELEHGKAYSLMTKILTEFLKEFEKEGKSVISQFGKIDTRPVKISEEAFRVLKVIKFETDFSNTDIIASALEKYLKNNEVN